MEFRKQLKIGLSIAFGWVPALLLMCFAVLAFVSGMANLFSEAFIISFGFVLLGALGILGFIALTSVCWGLKVEFFKRLWFLVCGVGSLLVASIYLIHNSSKSNLHDDATVYLFGYIFICPLVIGVYHLWLHIKCLIKVT